MHHQELCGIDGGSMPGVALNQVHYQMFASRVPTDRTDNVAVIGDDAMGVYFQFWKHAAEMVLAFPVHQHG